MVKKTLVAAIAAIVCVFLVTNTISSGITKYADAKIEIAENAAANSGSGAGGELGLDQQAGLMEGGSSLDSDSSVDAQTPSDDTAADTSTDSSADDAAKPDDSAKPGDAAQNSGSAQPKDGVETLNYYNSVIDKAVKAKVGYDKSRVTDNAQMEGSAGLEAMKSLVYQFMGIGEENKYTAKVEKGKWGDEALLNASKLTASDVTSATCKVAGDNYVITLKLKNGSSSANKSNPTTAPTTALDKSGICVGDRDRSEYDHKTGSVIYSAIGGTFAGAEVKESYSNATVTATVNAKTGNIVSLVVEWNQTVTLSKLLGMAADATGVSHVKYENFKY